MLSKVTAPPPTMDEERLKGAVRRRRHIDSKEANEARRRSRHLATFVVEEAKRG
jgi:hypothetical protein